jgi:amidophosphoribosyltransferase
MSGRTDEVKAGAGPEARDGCGVFGVAGAERAAKLAYLGLFALQHRGQESAGVATAWEGRLYLLKGMGLVSEALSSAEVENLPGEMAIGHVRYSTTGSPSLANAQPLLVSYRKNQVALAHNGNLVNALELRSAFEEEGSIFQTSSDTEIIAHLMARSGFPDPALALEAALRRVEGAFSLVVLTPETLMAARDPLGIRPLCLGRLGEAWVVASESCALDAVGASFVREVEPGELLIIRGGGEEALESTRFAENGRSAFCVFEFIYLSRPDSDLLGVNVHLARKEMGRLLAREHPAPGDLVIGVPDSSISAASGYAEEAGIPYEIGLIKNRYVGRTFIQPSQENRSAWVRVKFNCVRRVVEGKRVVLVDDSLVRGTTLRHLVGLIRRAGAQEVHVRIASPPYRFPCYYGIDTSSRGELAAATRTEEEICRFIGADSLRYLGLERLAEATGLPLDRFCAACFTGVYPVPVAPELGKHALEASLPGTFAGTGRTDRAAP